jgi:hypothetical protein
MKGSDPDGQTGPRKPLPDSVQIIDPPVDKIPSEPSSEQKEPYSVPVAAAPTEEYAAADSSFQQPEAYAEQPVF